MSDLDPTRLRDHPRSTISPASSPPRTRWWYLLSSHPHGGTARMPYRRQRLELSQVPTKSRTTRLQSMTRPTMRCTDRGCTSSRFPLLLGSGVTLSLIHSSLVPPSVLSAHSPYASLSPYLARVSLLQQPRPTVCNAMNPPRLSSTARDGPNSNGGVTLFAPGIPRHHRCRPMWLPDPDSSDGAFHHYLPRLVDAVGGESRVPRGARNTLAHTQTPVNHNPITDRTFVDLPAL